MKMRERILNDPKVLEISDERGNGDGIWVYFHYGWRVCEDFVHQVHEDTWPECLRKVKSAVPCDCPDCIPQEVAPD